MRSASQSPQTGQVYFNCRGDTETQHQKFSLVTIPSNGSIKSRGLKVLRKIPNSTSQAIYKLAKIIVPVNFIFPPLSTIKNAELLSSVFQ